MRRLLCGRSRGAWALAAAVTKPTGRSGREGAGGGGVVGRVGVRGEKAGAALSHSGRATDVCGMEGQQGGVGQGAAQGWGLQGAGGAEGGSPAMQLGSGDGSAVTGPSPCAGGSKEQERKGWAGKFGPSLQLPPSPLACHPRSSLLGKPRKRGCDGPGSLQAGSGTRPGQQPESPRWVSAFICRLPSAGGQIHHHAPSTAQTPRSVLSLSAPTVPHPTPVYRTTIWGKQSGPGDGPVIVTK